MRIGESVSGFVNLVSFFFYFDIHLHFSLFRFLFFRSAFPPFLCVWFAFVFLSLTVRPFSFSIFVLGDLLFPDFFFNFLCLSLFSRSTSSSPSTSYPLPSSSLVLLRWSLPLSLPDTPLPYFNFSSFLFFLFLAPPPAPHPPAKT